MRHFNDAAHLAQLGELMADLALPIADVVAIIAAFGSAHPEYLFPDSSRYHPDFGETDPTPVFEAWAQRVDFPTAWGGAKAWQHFRGLRLKH